MTIDTSILVDVILASFDAGFASVTANVDEIAMDLMEQGLNVTRNEVWNAVAQIASDLHDEDEQAWEIESH